MTKETFWMISVSARDKQWSTELYYLKPNSQTSKTFGQAYYFQVLGNKANFIKLWQLKWFLILREVLRILQIYNDLYFWITEKNSKLLIELRSLAPEAEGNAVQVIRCRSWGRLQETNDYHGLRLSSPHRFRLTSVFLATEKPNLPFILPFKAKSSLHSTILPS